MSGAEKKPETFTLVIEQLFDDTRQRVFEAWTDPDQLEIWCKPFDFTIPHQEGDIRPGGAYRTCLRGPDGTEHWLSGVYQEIVPFECIVFTHVWDTANGSPGVKTLVTVTFADFEGKTKMVFIQEGLDSKESMDGHEGGWSEAFEQLEEHLFTEAIGMI